MRGNITRRGKSSWRLKYDVGVGYQRQIAYVTVRGTRKQAEAELAKRLSALAEGRDVAPTVETVESYARQWLANIAPAERSPLTVERYSSIIRAHIIPRLGPIPLQALDGKAIDGFYAHCRTKGRRDGAGLASGTLQSVHRLLSQLLRSAVRAKKLARSPIDDVQTRPKPKRKKIDVLDESELATLLAHLKGHWLYMPTLLAAYTGMRRGEVLGLRWRDIDFDKGTLQVAQTMELVGGKVRVTAPKTDRSSRTINLSASLLPELTEHRKDQAALRLKLGLGKPDLVFTSPDGKAIHPVAFCNAFTHKTRATGLKTKFHALRHLHITYLLKSGVPVHVVSARAGHSRASITLDAYSHLLGDEDELAAKQADEILRRALGANPVPKARKNH
jgi:integrase